MVVRLVPTTRVKFNAEQALVIDNSALQAVVRACDKKFRKDEKELFSTEGASGGEVWQELSPYYKLKKDELFADLTKARNKEIRMRAKAYPDKKERAKIQKPQRLAENKILQLSGDMKRAFSTDGGGHIATGALAGNGRFTVTLGARGAQYFGDHFDGSGVPVRNQIQSTSEQKRAYINAIMPEILPHLMRRVKMTFAGV